jgi:hypothetical protein
MEQVVEFISDLDILRRYRKRVFKHACGFFRRYRSALNADQMAIALGNAAYFCAQNTLTTAFRQSSFLRRSPQRTHVSTTEILDPVYKPAFPVKACYEDYFKPTMLTDLSGRLVEELAEDLANPRNTERQKVAL